MLEHMQCVGVLQVVAVDELIIWRVIVVSGPLVAFFCCSAKSVIAEAFDCPVIDSVGIVFFDIFGCLAVGHLVVICEVRLVGLVRSDAFALFHGVLPLIRDRNQELRRCHGTHFFEAVLFIIERGADSVDHSLVGLNVISVIVLVCGVIGVHHDANVIEGVFRSHVVIADDRLPVPSVRIPLYHDRMSLFQLFLYPLRI